jgi:hypothetical protein
MDSISAKWSCYSMHHCDAFKNVTTMCLMAFVLAAKQRLISFAGVNCDKLSP